MDYFDAAPGEPHAEFFDGLLIEFDRYEVLDVVAHELRRRARARPHLKHAAAELGAIEQPGEDLRAQMLSPFRGGAEKRVVPVHAPTLWILRRRRRAAPRP